MTPSILIGPAGWSYPDWNGTVYPAKSGSGFDPLEYLSRYFDLVEINSTFYRIPSSRTSLRWAERIAGNREFSFTVKAHQALTHARQPVENDTVAAFTAAVSPLLESGRLRFILLQFPWSFKFAGRARDRIRKLAGALRPFPLALEVRHGSWAAPEAVDFVHEQRMTLCGIDQPQIGYSLTPATARAGPGGAYFRFHGRNAKEWFNPETNRDLRYNYLYTGEELKPWARTILAAAGQAQRGAVVVLNNHFRGQAVANALELKSLILNGPVAVPPPLLRTLPRLRTIARSDSELDRHSTDSIQGSLFQQQDNDEKKKEDSR